MAHSLSVMACSTLAALAGLGCGNLTSMSNRLVRSTNVPTALALPSPLIKYPPQCPGNCRSSTYAERTCMLCMSGIWPHLSWPLLRDGVYYGSGASCRPVPCAIRPPVERRCSCSWFRVMRAAYVNWDTAEPASGRFALASIVSTVKCSPSQTRRTVNSVYGQDGIDSGDGGNFAGN